MWLLIMTKWPKLINFCPTRVGRPINTGNCSRHVLIICFSLRADARVYRHYGIGSVFVVTWHFITKLRRDDVFIGTHILKKFFPRNF